MAATVNLRMMAGDILYSLGGVLLAAYALKGFLLPHLFLGGGVTALSILARQFIDLPFSIILILSNLPFILAGKFLISNRFAIKSLLSVAALSFCLEFMNFPQVTSDLSLISAFGGVFLGLGIGLAMRGGCSLDGVEVIALFTIKRIGLSISEIIFIINILIFMVAALNFGVETALHSILTYYTSSQAIDFVVEGLDEYTGVNIISSKSDEIKQSLVMDLGRGITIFKGERGFLKENFGSSQDCDIVFTVITRLEVRRLKNLVYQIDPQAFVFTYSIKEAAGGILKRKVGKQSGEE